MIRNGRCLPHCWVAMESHFFRLPLKAKTQVVSSGKQIQIGESFASLHFRIELMNRYQLFEQIAILRPEKICQCALIHNEILFSRLICSIRYPALAFSNLTELGKVGFDGIAEGKMCCRHERVPFGGF